MRWFWKNWLAGSLLLGSVFLDFARAESLGTSAPKIRAIVIERQDIFSAEQESLWLFRLANQLHLRTKETVVRRELLLKPGENYDSALAEETERNLRGLGIFGSVAVTPHPVSDTLADLLVETSDQWTTGGNFAFGGGGGAYEFSLGLEEQNFLGRGQRLELLYEESDLRVGRRVTFNDRKLASKPVSLSGIAESRSDGDYYFIEAGRPLYSSKDKWGATLRLFTYSDRLRFFDEGEEQFFFQEKTKEASLTALRSWGKEFKAHASLGYSITQNRFQGRAANIIDAREQYGYVLPEDRVHAAKAGFIWYANRYTEETYLDNFGVIEDIRNGESVSLEYVLSPKFLGSSLTRHEVAFSTGTTRKAGAHLFQVSAGNRTSFLSRSWEGSFWQGNLRYYWRWAERQTAAFRFDWSAINGLARYGQFLLGGETGLRGYEARTLSGSRMVLGTIEQRSFGPDLFSLFGLGGAVFVDFGEAWKADERFRSNELKGNWGAGLRLGLLRSSQFRVLRFDWARPFGPGGWVFTFGTGMSFELE
ncbi:MAG: BamA/TamA family outer membrane protein [candidate division Zixibacteria bacterium]|nr:BamA/TamA family outer membrane protein [candidate division Zixibacteria bacterium]